MTLPAFPAEGGRLQKIGPIDRQLLRGAHSYPSTSDARAQQQTSRAPPLLSIDGTDRRMDGHSTVMHRLCSAYYADSVSKFTSPKSSSFLRCADTNLTASTALFISVGICGVDASRARRRCRSDMRPNGQLALCSSVRSISCGLRRRLTSGVVGSSVVCQRHAPAHYASNNNNNNNRLTALRPGLPRRAGTRKVKPIWILLKQEAVSDSGISWAYASLHFAPNRQA